MTWGIDHEAPDEYVLITIVTKPDTASPVVNVYSGPTDKPWTRYEAKLAEQDTKYEAFDYDRGVMIETFVRKVHKQSKDGFQ